MSDSKSCGCCETIPELQPIDNRPGLTSLSYRIGVYGSFLERLLDQIYAAKVPDGPNQFKQPLTALTTRSADDPSISLLDAWAVVADVLTFYQERIANEGYLRTATERRSILELAREIGYELGPGVASNVLLQFAVDNIIGAAAPGQLKSALNSGTIVIPKGTQVQSIPGPNQSPQIFETSADFEARVERNQMLPRLERPADLAISGNKLYLLGTSTSFQKGHFGQLQVSQVYPLNPSTKLDPSATTVPAVGLNQIYLQGVNTNVKQGDRFVLVGQRGTKTKTLTFVVTDVETDSTANRTTVSFGPIYVPTFQARQFPAEAAPKQKLAFTEANVASNILEKNISESDLEALIANSGWNADDLASLVNTPPAPAAGDFGAFAMRASCGFFGHNAQRYLSIPNAATVYKNDWDTPNGGRGRLIWTDSQDNPYPDADVFLERSFPQILPSSWVLFESPFSGSATYQVDRVVERTLADYGMSGRATGLRLEIQADVRGTNLGSPAIVASGGQRTDIFAVGVDGHLYHRWKIGGGNFQGPESLGGEELVNSPSAVSWGGDRIDVFVCNSGGKLLHWWTDGSNHWSGPEDLGGKLASAPSAVSRESGSLDIFATGSDGSLYHFNYDNQAWSGPSPWGPGILRNAPSAVVLNANGLSVFSLGTDGDLYQTVWVKPGLRIGPYPLQTGYDSTFLVGSPSAVWFPLLSTFYVAMRTSDGAIVLLSPETFFGQQLGIWAAVAILEGNFTGAPVAVSNGFTEVDIFAIANDGDIHWATWNFSLTPFQLLTTKSLGGNGNLMQSPAVLRSGIDMELVAVGGEGHWFFTSYNGATWNAVTDLGNGNMVSFYVRSTTAFVQSELMQLAGVPILDDIPAGIEKLMLNNMVLGLQAGQPIAFTGMRADAPGVASQEMLTLVAVAHDGGFTTITFHPKLQHSYVRSTVAMNANVTAATNGATVSEVLGDGDGSQVNQSFTLKKPPLTFVSAPTPTGTAGTLQVRVNDLAWTETLTLYGHKSGDEVYTVRLGDEGTPTITFGEPAARLKSGKQNVRATYRTGIGLAGNVDSGSLTVLLSRPPGLRGVTNPAAASGGADPQQIGDARQNAPLTVLTLGRVVSLEDYENFARAFTGIGKAQAIAVWNGETRLVYLTVAASDGATIAAGSSTYNALVNAIRNLHDPVQQFAVAGYQPLKFNLTAAVLVNTPRYDSATVMSTVSSALEEHFSFSQRSFAQAVTEAEIVALIQSVPGVLACNLSQLYLSGDPTGPKQTEPPPFLAAAPARWQFGVIQPAQMLLLNASGVALKEMAA
jgi:hypothetical protein